MSEHKLEMCQRILKVLLCASFLAGRVGGEDGWFSSWGADTPDTAPGGLSDFDRDFQGFALGFNNPHSDGGSNYQSKQETVNPFVSKIFPKSTFQNAYVNQPIQAADPTRRITVHNDIKNPPYHRSPTPVQHYAPNYNQPRGQNQKYAVPNNGPQNNENGYGHRPHVVGRYRENAIPLTSGEIHPQYKQRYNEPNKVFTPYANVNSHLNRYENDPILDKVKDDVNANELRLKKNERVPSKHVDEEVDESDEDSSEETDEVLSRNQQNENFQPQYENYYPQNKPTYYEKPTNPTSDQRNINKYVVYPRHNHENIKIHPDAYQPLKDEISVLKQNQGNTFGGERVEYPEQKPEDEETSDENIAPDGQDIFERQKNAFDSVNANFEPNFNQFTDDHHPRAHVILEHTGSSGEDDNNSNSDESDTFIPVKMYAQVRHTDTTKHLPRDAAYQDAVTYDDVINAPRLREAIKSTKAQTVYTEEGYEDGAYDHAGHLKHASNHEAHGARAGGKHQGGGTHRDSGRQSYDDGGRSKHGSDVTHGKKWDVDEGNREDFDDHENYSLKDGNHAFSVHDLTQAGSEKLGAQNTTFAPFNNPKISKKIVMMSTIEKRYEDVLRPEDLDGNKEDDSIYYKRLGDEHTRHQVLIGDYLQKTKDFNSYIPYLLYKLHGSKPKKTKSKDDQKPAQSDVEVFKTNFKMNEGPRHGGNYKQIPIKNSESKEWPKRNDNIAKKNNIHRTENENGNDQNRNTHKNKEFLPERIVLKNANDSFEESSPPLVSEVSSESSEASAEENNEELVAFSNEPKILLERITTPERFDRRYNSNVDASSQENYDTKENAYAPRLERLEVLPRSGNSSAGYKDDQFPITSDVEVFRADFKKNKGPKHGGNYRKYSGEKRKRFREASELDDLNSFDDSTRSYLHGGNYRTSDDGSPKVDSDDVSESLVSGDYLDSNSTTY